MTRSVPCSVTRSSWCWPVTVCPGYPRPAVSRSGIWAGPMWQRAGYGRLNVTSGRPETGPPRDARDARGLRSGSAEPRRQAGPGKRNLLTWTASEPCPHRSTCVRGGRAWCADPRRGVRLRAGKPCFPVFTAVGWVPGCWRSSRMTASRVVVVPLPVTPGGSEGLVGAVGGAGRVGGLDTVVVGGARPESVQGGGLVHRAGPRARGPGRRGHRGAVAGAGAVVELVGGGLALRVDRAVQGGAGGEHPAGRVRAHGRGLAGPAAAGGRADEVHNAAGRQLGAGS